MNTMDTISLHLTSSQTHSRVVMHVDGEDYPAEFFGADHTSRAHTLACDVRDALKGGSKADALNLIA